MKSTSVFKPLCVLITSLTLIICAPQAFARGGHGGGGFGGGGFHGGGGHGGGFGGWRGSGFGGWRGGGWGGYGWRGYGWPGYGWRGWGPGWGWGFGIGFGWGWGSYWGGYPYAYGYPYRYYYPYYPYYYDGRYASAPQASDPYNRDPGGNSHQRNSSTPDSLNSPAGLVTTKATTPRPPDSNRRLVASNAETSYWTASFTTQQLTGLRPQARNVIRALLAMPPEARRRQIESGRYSNFSPEEQELFRNAAQLPPAPKRMSGE